MKYVGKRATKKRANATEAYLKEGQAACGWRSLNDLRPDRLRQYLDDLHAKDAGAAALNERIICWVALGNWLAGKRIKGKRSNWSGEKRLAKNPFEGLGKYDDATDRRPRRALNESELSRLLVAAAERPLIDAQMIRRGPRKGELGAALKPETAEKLKVLVRECALIYQTMILTGMRKGELASITIGQCVLDSDRPFIDLSARDEKSREGNDIPIRADLAAELMQWINDKQATNRPAVLAFKKNTETSSPADDLLFSVPNGLVRILNRDLAAAGIPKVDERGYSVDVHALRHSFGTLLSTSGVAPRVAQRAMRHSTLDLTMNVYTDPRLLDVHGALEYSSIVKRADQERRAKSNRNSWQTGGRFETATRGRFKSG